MDTDNKQLERDIENALRARGLQQQMRQWDAERVQSDDSQPLSSTSTKPSAWPKIRRTIYALSAVAAVLAVVVMAVPTSVWRGTFNKAYRWGMQQYAYYFGDAKADKKAAYQYTTTELMAMAEPSLEMIVQQRAELEALGAEDRIQDVVHQIVNGDYAVAQMTLQQLRDNLSDEDPYYQDKCQDIDYLEALCQLGQNRRSKAIKQLRAIADSPSKHRAAAEVLLEKVQLRK